MKQIVVALILCAGFSGLAEIGPIWITQSDGAATKAAINWYGTEKGEAVVRFGMDRDNLQTFRVSDPTPQNLHSVEVDISQRDVTYYYSVQTGSQTSEIKSFKGYPSKGGELRVVVFGNLGYFRFDDKLRHLRDKEPHLLVSCGDNIPALHTSKPVACDDISAFLKMIARDPKLFERVIFISAIGNHDREFKPRGKSRPPLAQPVYDVEAQAFRRFFAFPGAEWRWDLTIPDFDVQFLSVDSPHMNDVGTGWQACHTLDAGSEQCQWYRKMMDAATNKFVITFYNGSNLGMRRIHKGIWEKELAKGSLCVSGYGYYMEFAQTKNGLPYINTSLNAGDHYKDKANAVWSERVGGFLLLRFSSDETLTSEFYSIDDGRLLFARSVEGRR